MNDSTTPQEINTTTFAGVNRANIDLHVPTGSTQAYINAGWTGFKAIIEQHIIKIPCTYGNAPYSSIFINLTDETIELDQFAVKAYSINGGKTWKKGSQLIRSGMRCLIKPLNYG